MRMHRCPSGLNAESPPVAVSQAVETPAKAGSEDAMPGAYSAPRASSTALHPCLTLTTFNVFLSRFMLPSAAVPLLPPAIDPAIGLPGREPEEACKRLSFPIHGL